ncbi:16S rRNA (guanine(527)-N(7))-methyltransferase RsmG [bacterium]|nr:16S rRNA (guanine(527)-N(7))-methyltransferase RsmG [FCB group bacterium]MBL7191330.1 16S rRNA (guanine(527)-N(7))-methyltransferase RsmG [bacterium]
MEKYLYNYLLNIYKAYSFSNTVDFSLIIDSYKHYESLLKLWNLRVNLVSKRDVENLWKKHFIPSLKPLELELIPINSRCLDAGSGGGFPGIPLRIMRPDLVIDLCDSNRKKCLFLKEAVKLLGFQNFNVINGRVEELQGGYDIITSRAAGRPQEMIKLLNPLLAADGKLIIWTAANYDISMTSEDIVSYDVINSGKLIVIKKESL